jgi:hypothetical protein
MRSPRRPPSSVSTALALLGALLPSSLLLPPAAAAGPAGTIETADVTVRVTGPRPAPPGASGATAPNGSIGPDGPVEGAEVRLSTVRGEPRYESTLATGADGRVRFEAVPDGTYWLFVEHPIYPALRIHDQRITLETERIDLRLPAPADGWAPVAGRVVRDGEGVAGVEVSFSRHALSGYQHYEAVTGEDGGFAFPALPVGEYQVTWKPGDDSGYPRRHLPEALPVRGQSVTDIVLPLPRGVRLTGTVENLGTVPREWLSVSAGTLPADAPRRSFAQGTLDPGGAFELHGLEPGTWRILVKAQGREVRETVEIPEDAGPEMRLEAPIVLPVGHDVPGTVFLDGEPLEGARIDLTSAGPEGATGLGAYEPSDAGGRFVLSRIPPGEYNLGVSLPEAGKIHHERVTIAAGSKLVLDLRPPSVAGRLVDAVTGEPVSGGHLQVGYRGPGSYTSHSHPSWVTVDGDGSFHAGPLESGEWSFRFSAPGYVPTTRRLDLPEGRRLDGLEVEMHPTAGLPVHVTMENDEVPSRVELVLFHHDWEERNREQPGSGGPVAKWSESPGHDPDIFWKEAPAGRWVLEVRTEGGGTTSLPVEIAARVATQPVEVVLSTIGSLAAHVAELEDEGASASADAHLSLASTDGVVLGDDCRCWRGKRGYFYARNVPPGRYLATVTAADGRSWTAEVEIEPGERTAAELDANGPE